MKKKIFFMLLGAMSLTACTGDDATEVTNEPELKNLKRVVLYSPQFENYSFKTHIYYDNNEKTADSTFNNSGELQFRNVYSMNGNTHTITRFNASGTITATVVSQYDAQGRLTSYDFDDYHYTYTYNSDGSITASYLTGGEYSAFSRFTVNTEGYLETQEFLNTSPDDNEIHTIVYDNGRPAELIMENNLFPPQTLLTYNYYTNTKPANMVRPAVKVNNDVLRSSQINTIGHFCNYYLEEITGVEGILFSSAKTFDPADDYIATDKRTFGGNGDGEYFYEYN